MRGVLIAGALSLVVVTSQAAQAADQSAPWSGFYVGANLGYGWSDRNFTNTITGVSPTIDLSVANKGHDHGDGVLGGVQLGYNYRFLNNWVAGAEADFDAADINASTSACFTGFASAVCGSRQTDLKDFGTVRARLGYALDQVLVYGTGGWAWSHGANTIRFTCIGAGCPGASAVPPTTPQPAKVDVSPSGWGAGGGVEWTFRPHLSLRAEYLHLQLDGARENRSKSPPVAPGLVVTSHVSSTMDADLVRLGVNYWF